MENSDDPLLDGDRFFAAIEEVSKWPRNPNSIGSAGFDTAAAHITQLLTDAVEIFVGGSYGTATFLALTAMEETSKLEMMLYQGKGGKNEKPKGRDPMRDHAKKHLIAIRPTVFMSRKLVERIGRERCLAIKSEAEGGGLTALREASLYVDFELRPIVTPMSAVSSQRAYEMLLVAFEAADDILVGYTRQSYVYGRQIEAMSVRLVGLRS